MKEIYERLRAALHAKLPAAYLASVRVIGADGGKMRDRRRQEA
jgi:hypothetical protein